MLVMPTKDALITLGRDSEYATRHREHLKLVSELQALGAQVYADLKPPRIAFVGRQGAGKSTLIEAISGITVSRDATSTRCPIEFRMSHTPDSPWSCKVSIWWKFTPDGLPLTGKKLRRPSFGPQLTNKADIDLVLRRAQAAVLNPQGDLQDFVTMSPEALGNFGAYELLYSRNVVCVELSGPEMTDITFVDLPGIADDPLLETEKLVRDVVLSYINKDCTIVLVTSTEDDLLPIDIAQEVDPHGARTLGVLTKPDTISLHAGVMNTWWVRILEGHRFPLALGHFCTLQRDKQEKWARISDYDEQEAESTFFATTEPWCISTHQHRLGTQKLVAAISTHLARGIDKSFRELATETTRLLASCNARLEMLPRPMSPEPFMFILSLVQKFAGGIQAFVNGRVDTTTLVRENRASYANLNKRICSTAPLFVPHTQVVSLSLLPRALLGIDCPASAGSVSVQITLEDVRHRMQSAVTRELSNNVPYAAKMLFVKDFQKEWSSIAHDTAEVVHASLLQVVACLIKEHFAQYQFLEPHVRATVAKLVQAKFDVTCAQISRLLQYETTAFTQNDHYLSDTKERLLVGYRDWHLQRLRQDTQTPPAFAQTAKAKPSEPILQASKQPSPSPSVVPDTVAGESPTTNLGVVKTTKPPIPREPTPPSKCYVSPAPSVTSDAALPLTGKRSKVTAPIAVAPPGYFVAKGGSISKQLPSCERTASKAPSSAAKKEILTNDEYEHEGRKPTREELECAAQRSAERDREREHDQRMRDEALALEVLARLGYKNLTTTDFEKLRGPGQDEFDEELEVMAEVRAYFNVAYKRIIDYVPLAIDHELLYAFANELQTHLLSSLGLSSGDVAAKSAAYLAEDPNVVAERDGLLARKERLLSIQAQLRDAGVSG